MMRPSPVAAVLVLLLLRADLFCSRRSAAETTADDRARRVLIINEVNASYPTISLLDESLRTSLQKSTYRVDLYREYMETALFPDPADQSLFRQFYARKYRARQPDVIITVGSSPLRFMAESHREIFPRVPIIFCLSNGAEDEVELGPDFTGIKMGIEAADTIKSALQLLPKTERVLVVAGVGPFDRQMVREVKDQLKEYESRIHISYLDDLSFPTQLTRLKSAPPNSVVLFAALSRDVAGTNFSTRETIPQIVSASSVPVFTLVDVSINHGEVGGKLSEIKAQGESAGAMVLKLLTGDSPRQIPVERSPSTYIFDWRALKRWGMNEGDLPPGSSLLNRQLTAWEEYRGYIIGLISLMVLETLLLFALFWQRAKRRESEANLALTNDRLRMAVEVGKSVGWDGNLKTGRSRWFGDLQTLFGIAAEVYIAEVGELAEYVHPEDRELTSKAVADAHNNRTPCVAEFRVIRRDGAPRWIAARGEFLCSKSGVPERMVGMATDITDRKLAEQQIAGMGRKLLEAQEQERAWIARELHDDINQRIALLSVELRTWSDKLREVSDDYFQRARQTLHQLSELGKDIQALSHRLHSSKLDYLGLAGAANSFCKELAELHKVEVDFHQSDIPRTLPKEISLCIFRVLQEALQNAVKYSGVRTFKVELQGKPNGIHVVVSDRGKGFDTSNAMVRKGLGLVSMRERLSMVGGTFNLQSTPGQGTTVEAFVSLAAGTSTLGQSTHSAPGARHAI